jgi:lipopolysaccharide/colanic/teichoic acid biosynthesis glycosyltransferase
MFDVLLSGTAIVLLAAPLAIIAICIKLDAPGPILYCGERVGRNGRRFRIAKFRTMVTGADKIGASSTSDDDPRITRSGHWLRRLKLDELPQLFNVFFGTMSFVGPRPQVAWAVDLYSDEEKKLLTVRPGITDYASLVFRNEGEILRGSKDPDGDYLRLIAPRKNLLGLAYVHDHGLGVDVKVIVATALAILGMDPSWCLSRKAQQALDTYDAKQNLPLSRAA